MCGRVSCVCSCVRKYEGTLKYESTFVRRYESTFEGKLFTYTAVCSCALYPTSETATISRRWPHISRSRAGPATMS